ncbi:2552_t:CDS:1, partial [Acaulospora colombiana]
LASSNTSSVHTTDTSESNSVKSRNDIEQTSTSQVQTQQTSTNDVTLQAKKKKFVVGTDDGIEENSEAQETNSQETAELSNNANGVVENHRDTKVRFYKPYPAEEVAKVAEERKAQKLSQQKQIAEPSVQETAEADACTSESPLPPETTTAAANAVTPEQKKLNAEGDTEATNEEINPSNVESSASPSNEPTVKDVIIPEPYPQLIAPSNSPTLRSSDDTPIVSPFSKILDAPLVTSENMRNHAIFSD